MADSDALALPDLAAIRPRMRASRRTCTHAGVHLAARWTRRSAPACSSSARTCRRWARSRRAARATPCSRFPTTLAARGVVTHSSGNHGAALAYAAQRRGIPAHVVMPENAPKIKIANVESFGAQDSLLRADVARAREAVRGTPARRPAPRWCILTTIAAVIAGQGTAALELVEHDARSRRGRRAQSAAAACCRERPSRRHGAIRGIDVSAPSPRAPTTRRAASPAASSKPMPQSADHRRRAAQPRCRRARCARCARTSRRSAPAARRRSWPRCA